MLVHDDKGGISGAAVFVALLDLLQKVDEAMLPPDSQLEWVQQEEVIDTLNIFSVVNGLRIARGKMIRNFEEYVFWFRAVVYYAQRKSEYAMIISPNPDAPIVVHNPDDAQDPYTTAMNVRESPDSDHIFYYYIDGSATKQLERPQSVSYVLSEDGE